MVRNIAGPKLLICSGGLVGDWSLNRKCVLSWVDRSVVLAEEDRGSVCVAQHVVWTPFKSTEREKNTHIEIKRDDHREE